jgi:hypothetical protein
MLPCGGQVVYDLVYNPPQTVLLRQAAEAGAQAIGGLGMLVWQGALAFERWTGRPAPVHVMRSGGGAFCRASQRRSAASRPARLCAGASPRWRTARRSAN